MKTLRLILAAAVLALAGCATITANVTKQIETVRNAFNSLLPSDFNGPVDLSFSDMYATVTIRATGVHKLPSGEWTWASVSYAGTLSIPWFAGLTYKREDRFTIGTPTGVALMSLARELPFASQAEIWDAQAAAVKDLGAQMEKARNARLRAPVPPNYLGPDGSKGFSGPDGRAATVGK